MAQQTADVSRKFKLSPDSHTEQPVDAAIIIYMGSGVGLNSGTSLARQLVGGDQFSGFAYAPAWNILDPYRPGLTYNGNLVSAAGAINVEVRTQGVIDLEPSQIAGATASTPLTTPVYMSDGNTFTLGVQTQTLTETGTPTGGTFVLAANGSNSSAIAYNALGTAVLAALPASVTGAISSVTGVAGGPWTVNWNPGATTYAITLATNSLTGGASPSVTIGTSAVSTALSKIGTIRTYVYGLFEVLFAAVTG